MAVQAIATVIKTGKWDADEFSPYFIRQYSIAWLVSCDETKSVMGPYVVWNREIKQLFDPIAREFITASYDDAVLIPQDQISNQQQVHDKNGIHKLRKYLCPH